MNRRGQSLASRSQKPGARAKPGPKAAPQHLASFRPRASSLSGIPSSNEEDKLAVDSTERHAHFADDLTSQQPKVHAPNVHPTPVRSALANKGAVRMPLPQSTSPVVPPKAEQGEGYPLGPDGNLPSHPIGKPLIPVALATVLDPAVEKARAFNAPRKLPVSHDYSTTAKNWKDTDAPPLTSHHANEEWLRKRYKLLGMRPSFSLALQEEARQGGLGLVYDAGDDLELHLDHHGTNCLSEVTHVFIKVGSRALQQVVPTDIQFANKYEVVCGNTCQRLFVACETLEELNREHCCNEQAQPYELVILTSAGKGLFTMSRRRREVVFSDFVRDIARMAPGGQNVDRFPQTYTLWEGDKELCKLISNPFADKGEYEILVGTRDDYVGRIGRSWTDLRGGPTNSFKDHLGLKFSRELDTKLKGYLVGALFNAYFTFDHGKEDGPAHDKKKKQRKHSMDSNV